MFVVTITCIYTSALTQVRLQTNCTHAHVYADAHAPITQTSTVCIQYIMLSLYALRADAYIHKETHT